MALKGFTTVGELMDILKDLSPETIIVHYEEGMEKRGFEKRAYLDTEEGSYKEVKKDTYDAFDGDPYTYTTLERADDGPIKAIRLI